MRSGRHGAVRPPVGVLIQQDRTDFILFAVILLVAVGVMALTGWTSPAFWVSLLSVPATVVLMIRRIDRLSRDELRAEELL
ncbi:hypothetical protein O4J56_05230 [Nocardiopsis sp. RSe5-2]|uniref:Uncharacterized protein n=1 Tax=Nocardiopsis endophytica TaxID=3018445 RepID=A0ABT4TZ99_9ACTN|nr:hypothetical protein [Nocardiopsis endophytica]MDA2810033.1 hypothetical protein [Nocardiopsis endophytica]